MKSPADYLENHVFEARRSRRDLQPVVAYDTAVQAIEQALADAEKYKYLLIRALRRHDDATNGVKPVLPESSFFTPETPVRPLYPDSNRLAA